LLVRNKTAGPKRPQQIIDNPALIVGVGLDITKMAAAVGFLYQFAGK
jgi:hypothetical protein